MSNNIFNAGQASGAPNSRSGGDVGRAFDTAAQGQRAASTVSQAATGRDGGNAASSAVNRATTDSTSGQITGSNDNNPKDPEPIVSPPTAKPNRSVRDQVASAYKRWVRGPEENGQVPMALPAVLVVLLVVSSTLLLFLD